MFGKATEILRVPELRKKILWTLGLLFLFRLGNHILLPGVDPEEFVRRLGTGNSGVIGILNALSGGALGSATVFSLGVMPYISASIVFSLLQKMVPALEQVAKEGQSGQRKINQWTRWATVPICLFQAGITVTTLISQDVSQGGQPLISPELFASFWYKTAIVLILTAGTLLIMWIGEKITEHGIGQGTSLIIMAGIIARLPTQISTSLSGDPEHKTQFIAEIVGLFVISVIAVVFFTKAQRRVPIQQAKLTRGRRQLGGARHFIPLKVSAVGVMPIVFAQTLFVIPSMLGKAPGLGFINEYFGYESFLYLLFYTALIFFFSFFWTAVMFQPKEMANNLKEYGSFIPGIRPGQRTAEYLEGVMVRVTLVGAAFLAVIALFPYFANDLLGTSGGRGIAYAIGGTSILITVGVCLDLVDKINAQLVMRNYEGFTGGQTGGGWARRREAGGEGE
ncbi:MAG: preprotein translocase subunit SecY [Planctomycetes bacterium]|nr:preprotein translocase subunit SecY [Planctomycetota bacterium]